MRNCGLSAPATRVGDGTFRTVVRSVVQLTRQICSRQRRREIQASFLEIVSLAVNDSKSLILCLFIRV